MELKVEQIIQGLRDNDSPYKSDQDNIRDAIAIINELTEEKANLHASCTELTRKLECANLEIECKERICESYMLQYGTVADKEVFLKKERADTVQKMQAEIEARCIKGGIYPAFVERTIEKIVEEMLEEK